MLMHNTLILNREEGKLLPQADGELESRKNE